MAAHIPCICVAHVRSPLPSPLSPFLLSSLPPSLHACAMRHMYPSPSTHPHILNRAPATSPVVGDHLLHRNERLVLDCRVRVLAHGSGGGDKTRSDKQQPPRSSQARMRRNMHACANTHTHTHKHKHTQKHAHGCVCLTSIRAMILGLAASSSRIFLPKG